MKTQYFNETEHAHRRYNPLTGEWVLVCPDRTSRPWQGKLDEPAAAPEKYDPTCYLCPGNKRATGQTNDNYDSTYVFNNDFSALKPEKVIIDPAVTTDAAAASESHHALFQQVPEQGECRVICFSPDHSKTLPQLSESNILTVVNCWVEQLNELSQHYQWVQIFENKGAVMGCSNPHPHGQIWAQTQLPTLVAKKDQQQRAYFEKHASPMLFDYAQSESKNKTRTVVENEHWIAVVPYWAAWPFEILLLPKAHHLHLNTLSEDEKKTLSSILKRLTTRYDNLFNTSFPYSMGWHGWSEKTSGSAEHWQLHAHFFPPLLRSAKVRKFMVGYEMMAETQRDLTAEQAAQKLRDVSEIHYTEA